MKETDFEWDPAKNQINHDKHGVRFEQVIAIWDDPYHIEFELDYEGEDRYAVAGLFKDRIWTVIATRRGEKIRIISARRAHKDEEDLYYED
jgi:uncharacterized DUF497 family protein